MDDCGRAGQYATRRQERGITHVAFSFESSLGDKEASMLDNLLPDLDVGRKRRQKQNGGEEVVLGLEDGGGGLAESEGGR